MVVVLMTLGCVSAAPANQDESGLAEQWEYVVAGWVAEREKLTSAELNVEVVTQPFERVAEEPPYDLLGPLPIEKGTFRIVLDAGATYQESHFGGPEAGAIRWIDRSGELHHWTDAGREAGFLVIAMTSDAQPETLMRFQPRVLGFIGVPELLASMYPDAFSFLQRLFSESAIPQSVELLDADRQLWKFMIEGDDVDTHYQVVFNESAGFSVESASSGFAFDDDKLYATSVLTTQWREFNGCWLPVSCREARRSGLRTVETTLIWNSVNESVDPSVFDYQQHDSAQGLRVLDQRLGTENAFIVGAVGEEDFLAPGVATARSAPRRTRLLIIIGVNAGLMILLAVVVYVKHAKQRREGRKNA